MKILPREQDKLLKQLADLENRSRKGTKPELIVVVFSLIVLSTISFGIIVLNDYYSNYGRNILGVTLIWLLLIASLYGCYKGNKYAYAFSTIISLGLNVAFTYFISSAHPNYQSLCLIGDIFTLILITTLFSNSGYLISTFLVIVKNFFFYFVLRLQIDYISIFIDTIIVFTTGTFMLMIIYLFRLSENAKMAMIRAEILALQNQELISSWETFFKKK